MSYRILWPAMRWPDGRHIEESSVVGHSAEFCERYTDVTDDQWANCDAVVSVNDIPEEYRQKMTKCRIFVTPKVGFDNIDGKAWAEMGIPLCNVPDYGTQEVADHAMALMLSLMKGITFHTRGKQDPRGLWHPALNPLVKDCLPVPSVLSVLAALELPPRCEPKPSAWMWSCTTPIEKTAQSWR